MQKEHLYPKLELGDGGTIFRWTGEAGTPLVKIAENDSLTISIKDGLEVKDDKGEIVLQVRLKEDRIQFQAVFYDGPESGLAIGRASDGVGGVVEIFRKNDHKRTLKIKPMFKYPSDLHLGHLIG